MVVNLAQGDLPFKLYSGHALVRFLNSSSASILVEN